MVSVFKFTRINIEISAEIRLSDLSSFRSCNVLFKLLTKPYTVVQIVPLTLDLGTLIRRNNVCYGFIPRD